MMDTCDFPTLVSCCSVQRATSICCVVSFAKKADMKTEERVV